MDWHDSYRMIIWLSYGSWKKSLKTQKILANLGWALLHSYQHLHDSNCLGHQMLNFLHLNAISKWHMRWTREISLGQQEPINTPKWCPSTTFVVRRRQHLLRRPNACSQLCEIPIFNPRSVYNCQFQKIFFKKSVRTVKFILNSTNYLLMKESFRRWILTNY